jgi:cytochrome c553
VRRQILTAAGVFAFATAAQAQRPEGSASFVAYGCYQCHGYVGQGGAAPRIAPTAYPFEAFDRLVRRPANEMPAYAAVALDEATLRAIYDYLRSIPEPPVAANLAILR